WPAGPCWAASPNPTKWSGRHCCCAPTQAVSSPARPSWSTAAPSPAESASGKARTVSQLATEYLPSGVVVLTIDRPHRRNALDNQTVAELHTVLDEVNGKPDVRAVVITGSGAGFSAGADLKAQPEDFTATDATPTAA